jgi:tetratricopeptide (TPR) repeat protein
MNNRELYDAGRARMEVGAIEEAIELFRRSADLEPHFKTLELLGECNARVGRLSKAIVPLAAATTLNPQSRAPALLAEVFERLGRQEDARTMAQLAIERDRNNKLAAAVLARLGTSRT